MHNPQKLLDNPFYFHDKKLKYDRKYVKQKIREIEMAFVSVLL